METVKVQFHLFMILSIVVAWKRKLVETMLTRVEFPNFPACKTGEADVQENTAFRKSSSVVNLP